VLSGAPSVAPQRTNNMLPTGNTCFFCKIEFSDQSSLDDHSCEYGWGFMGDPSGRIQIYLEAAKDDALDNDDEAEEDFLWFVDGLMLLINQDHEIKRDLDRYLSGDWAPPQYENDLTNLLWKPWIAYGYSLLTRVLIGRPWGVLSDPDIADGIVQQVGSHADWLHDQPEVGQSENFLMTKVAVEFALASLHLYLGESSTASKLFHLFLENPKVLDVRHAIPSIERLEALAWDHPTPFRFEDSQSFLPVVYSIVNMIPAFAIGSSKFPTWTGLELVEPDVTNPDELLLRSSLHRRVAMLSGIPGPAAQLAIAIIRRCWRESTEDSNSAAQRISYSCVALNESTRLLHSRNLTSGSESDPRIPELTINNVAWNIGYQLADQPGLVSELMMQFQIRQLNNPIGNVGEAKSFFSETPHHDWLTFGPLLNLEVWANGLHAENLHLLRNDLFDKYSGAFVQQVFEWRAVDSTTQVYWALRIGYVDFLIANPEYPRRKNIQDEIEAPAIPSLAENRLRIVALRQIRADKKFDEFTDLFLNRLPPNDESLMTTLLDRLGKSLLELPSSAIDDLKSAEQLFLTNSDRAYCRLLYFKVIEGTFKDVFVIPLMNYIQAAGYRGVVLPRHNLEATLRKRKELDRIQLFEWSHILQGLPAFIGSSTEKELVAKFLQDHLNRSSLPDLPSLSAGLLSAHEARGGAAHSVDVKARYDADISGIHQLRDLIYGGESEPILESMLKMLARRD